AECRWAGGRQGRLLEVDDVGDGAGGGIEVVYTRGGDFSRGGGPAGSVACNVIESGAGRDGEGVGKLFIGGTGTRERQVDAGLDAFVADPPGVAVDGRGIGEAGDFGLDVHHGGHDVVDGHAGGIERGGDAVGSDQQARGAGGAGGVDDLDVGGGGGRGRGEAGDGCRGRKGDAGGRRGDLALVADVADTAARIEGGG